MTDEELVKRLRAVEIDDDHDLWENSHLLAEAAAAIERLTRERDEALRRRIVYSPDAKALSDRADAAERKVEKLREALKDILADIEDYERRNKLAPSPGKPDCWQSVTNARATITETENTNQYHLLKGVSIND